MILLWKSGKTFQLVRMLDPSALLKKTRAAGSSRFSDNIKSTGCLLYQRRETELIHIKYRDNRILCL